MSIYPLLRKDHSEIRKLLKKLENNDETALATRRDLFSTVKNDILLHSEAEYHTLYVALKEHDETHAMILKDAAKHRHIDVLLDELGCINAVSDAWLAKLAVLKESLERHMAEEEQTLFCKARALLSDEQADEMGRFFQAQKQTTLATL